MKDKKHITYKSVVDRVLNGDGMASGNLRRAAFENTGLSGSTAILVNKVARESPKVTDEDIIAVKSSGLSEDQIFEMVVCAAIGQASRQYEAALEALTKATSKNNGSQNET